MARGKAGKIRQNGKDHGINPKARIPSRRNVGVSFQERHSTGFQIERFRRLQKTSDTTEVNHRKRNFGGCGQWTTFRGGRIRVLDEWPTYFRHPSMTPYQYFEEISPLLCTTDVPFEIIGDHMQEHVRRSELSEKPRRLLVGGMRARQMLIATPLLKWYLEHEMVITKIYHVVEFIPHRCFRDFVREVGDNRRLGDAHPDKAIIGDTSKLHDNSSYGGTIIDQEKFQSITYVQGEVNAALEANKPQFKELSTLLDEDEHFEVEKSKEKLDLNFPIQIGYFILQYAKLRMLQFYYNFLDSYILILI
jgi:hypothetical protein